MLRVRVWVPWLQGIRYWASGCKASGFGYSAAVKQPLTHWVFGVRVFKHQGVENQGLGSWASGVLGLGVLSTGHQGI